MLAKTLAPLVCLADLPTLERASGRAPDREDAQAHGSIDRESPHHSHPSARAYGRAHAETRRRRLRFGASMTPAKRLAWLEEMLDELLSLLGRARDATRGPESRLRTADEDETTRP